MFPVPRFSRCIQLLTRSFTRSAARPSEELMVHRDSSDNNPSVKFDFTPDNMERIRAMIDNYPRGYERAALGGALDLAQRQHGWVTISAMHRVAAILNIPKMRVYEYATFYTMYRRRFMGKYLIQVCGTTPCMLRGAEEVLAAAEQAAGAPDGSVSCDGMFGVFTVECQGACANAPVVAVNDDYYEDLTPEGIACIIQQLRDGEIPPAGPQNGRYAAEPCTGPTSLLCPPPGPDHMLQAALQGGGGGGGGGCGGGGGDKK